MADLDWNNIGQEQRYNDETEYLIVKQQKAAQKAMEDIAGKSLGVSLDGQQIDILEVIAKRSLGISLVPRNSDRLDFHEFSVHRLKDALKMAFEAGVNFQAEMEKRLPKL